MRIAIVAAFFALGLSAQTSQGPQIPHKAREFSLVEPSGKQTLLSSLKGKVVVIQFLHTTCGHCQAYSIFLGKLVTELGPRGFQAWGVAFNDADAKMAADYKQVFAANFPVGYAARPTVMSFLSIPEQALGVPQIVVIDRKGQVRAQTSPRDEDKVSEIRKEPEMRKLLDMLLKETAAPATSAAVKKTTN
jgi:thiol-disulfide isomerase/thioredoxin